MTKSQRSQAIKEGRKRAQEERARRSALIELERAKMRATEGAKGIGGVYENKAELEPYNQIDELRLSTMEGRIQAQEKELLYLYRRCFGNEMV